MRRLVFAAALTLAMPAMAQEAPTVFDEAEHRWQHRLVYIFAPSDTLDAFAATLDRFEAQSAAVAERDGVVLVLPHQGTPRQLGTGLLQRDVGPTLRSRYGIADEEAVLVLVGKDGTEKARYALPADPADVFARIDTMPMRQREMRQRSGG
ncbi:MAG: DUF4174 domain-containing protein [Bacteroidota bacterium]